MPLQVEAFGFFTFLKTARSEVGAGLIKGDTGYPGREARFESELFEMLIRSAKSILGKLFSDASLSPARMRFISSGSL
jgi:hypothetical protein